MTGKMQKVKNISLAILREIAICLEAGHDIFLDQKTFYKKINYTGFDSQYLFQKIRYLKRTGYIKINEKTSSIKLLKKGKIKLLENNPENIKDGKWRMISFDIPEKYRKSRDQFRRSIKRIGFRQVQKSLWACPYIKANEVNLIINELKINKYVVYLIVEKTDIEKHLKHLFKKKLI